MSTVHQIHRRQQIDAGLAECADDLPYIGNDPDLWRGITERDMLRRGRKEGPPILPEPVRVTHRRVRRSWVPLIVGVIAIAALCAALGFALMSILDDWHIVQRQAVEVRA